MRTLPTRENCCGCSACAAICPKSAISMRADNEGFLQPSVNEHSCVNCGVCERVCPVLNPSLPRRPISCHIAKSKDNAERMKSSSGAVFPVFARHILSHGGKVYGVAWKDNPFRAVHIGIDCIEDIACLRGSKYVQSEIGSAYQDVKEDLIAGRQVLFTGCPCQIAGLKSFLAKDYDNLITQEVICNSAPSPKALTSWIEAEQKKIPNEKLINIIFRDKSAGWHNATLKFAFSTTTTTCFQQSAYYRLWQRGYTVRRCCIECDFRDLKSGADLTIGDFWGVEKVKPEYDDNMGVSVVLVNTKKGQEFWNEVEKDFIADSVQYESVLAKNPCLHKSFELLKTAGGKRDAFWKKISSGANIKRLGIVITRDPLSSRIRVCVGRMLRSMGLRK